MLTIHSHFINIVFHFGRLESVSFLKIKNVLKSGIRYRDLRPQRQGLFHDSWFTEWNQLWTMMMFYLCHWTLHLNPLYCDQFARICIWWSAIPDPGINGPTCIITYNLIQWKIECESNGSTKNILCSLLVRSRLGATWHRKSQLEFGI